MFSQPLNRIAAGLLCAFCAACGGDSGETIAAGPPVSIGADSRLASNADQQSALPDIVFAPAASLLDPAAVAAAGGPFGHDPAGYTLTFLDTFDGELDRTVWNTQRHETPNTVPNFATRNGILKIWPERGRNGEFFYRTLDTEGRFAQRYGYFEIEAKLPKGQGVWPSFWLHTRVGGVYREIDIMEAYPSGIPPWSEIGPDGVPTAVMHAPVVWTGLEAEVGSAKFPTPDLAAAFHRYGAKWEPARITFYFDGREVLVVNAAIAEPMFMFVDLKFGSASGEPDASTPTGESNSLEVNYVKAWQFK
jgi:beta-glucanase (GH16 family)